MAREVWSGTSPTSTVAASAPGRRIEIGEPGEGGERHRVVGGAGRDRLVDVAAALVDEARAEGEAPLALAPAGAEAGVALHRLDVAVAAIHGRLELVQRHVLASTHQCLHATSMTGSAPPAYSGAAVLEPAPQN